MEGQRRGRRAWWGWRVGIRPRRRTVDGSGPRQRARGCREEMRVYSKCKGIGEQWVRGGPPSCLLLSPSERSRHTTGKAADSSTGFSSGTRGGTVGSESFTGLGPESWARAPKQSVKGAWGEGWRSEEQEWPWEHGRCNGRGARDAVWAPCAPRPRARRR